MAKSKIKILIVASGFPPEATSGRLSYELSKEFDRCGHRVQVVTLSPRKHLVPQRFQSHKNKLFYREEMGGVDVIRVKPFFPHGETFFARVAEYILLPASLLLGVLISRKSDVIFCESPPLTVPFVFLLLKKILRVPVVVRIQDLHPEVLVGLGLLKNKYLKRILAVIERIVYRKADHLSGISEGYRKYIITRGVDPKKVDVIPNWADLEVETSDELDEFRRENGLLGNFLVTYAGFMSWPQDLETIVDGAFLLQQHKDIRFLLVGDGSQKAHLEEKCRKLKLENVKFLPLQPRDDYLQILQASDACLVSLKRSMVTPTLPSKTLDIMACARPIIANVPLDGDVPKMLADAKCGLAVEPQNPKALSEAVLKMYKNPDFAEELGRNAREYLEKHFSLKACTEKYEEIISKMIYCARDKVVNRLILSK